MYIRVAVCDPTLGTAMLESNCVQYGANYKPEGLLQQYSQKIRFSAIGYLNQGGNVREGGVLRAPMRFVGPNIPQPLSSTLLPNPGTEWDPTTGIMGLNPDTASASASGVAQSGVMNYLNKFGEFSQTYKIYDNVSELYYAAVRYFENLGNVPEWTNGASATALDGFPAVTAWTDPILYSCQKNFILGIGDDHTWYDYDVGGSTNASGGRAMPAAVAADTFNQATHGRLICSRSRASRKRPGGRSIPAPLISSRAWPMACTRMTSAPTSRIRRRFPPIGWMSRKTSASRT